MPTETGGMLDLLMNEFLKAFTVAGDCPDKTIQRKKIMPILARRH